MDFGQLSNLFQTETLVRLLFKAFAIGFSILYILYAIIITKQTSVLNDTIKEREAGTLSFISSLQIIFGLILISLAILFV